MATIGVWPLDKYARLVPDSKDTLPLSGSGGKKGGSWTHYMSSKDAVIQLALLDSNHLMISRGTHIYESFSLWDAQKWIKGVSKGDSILFIYQLKEDTRRFRIKFSAQSPTKTPLQTCNDCISKLCPLIPIRDISASSAIASYSQATQPPVEESQMFSQVQETNLTLPAGSSITLQPNEGLHSDSGENLNGSYPDMMSVSELAKEVSTDGKSLGKAYANTNFPVSQLSDFIRLCLTDSNFPAFVGAAEKELQNITN